MNKTAKNSIIYVIGTLGIGIVSLFSTVILTRFLPEQTYAQYGLLVSFCTTVVTVVSLGSDASYTRFFYESGYSPFGFLLRCCGGSLILLGIFSLLLLEPNRFLLTYVFGERCDTVFALLVVGYLAVLLISRFSQLTARMGEFAVNYVASNFMAKVGFLLGIILLYRLIPSVTISWVALSFLITTLLAVLINAYTFRRVRLPASAAAQKKVSAKEIFSYGLPIMLNNSLFLVIPLAEKIVVRDLAGSTVLAIYTAASVFYTVMTLLETMLNNIWHPIVFQHYQNKPFFQPLLHDFGLFLSGLTVAGLGLCILLRRWLVLILSENYRDAYLIAPAIMFSACFEIYSMVYGAGVNVQKKTLHLVVSSVLQAAVSFSLCFLLIPPLGLIGVGIASLTGMAVSKGYCIALGLHYYGTDRKEIKPPLLWIAGFAASLTVMFSTSLISDILVCVALILWCVLVLNREAVGIVVKCRDVLFSKGKGKTAD